MRLISIYSKFKAAAPALSILATRESAHRETADGRFVCRRKRLARIDIRVDIRVAIRVDAYGGAGADAYVDPRAANNRPNPSKATLVCRGVSGVRRCATLGPRAATALPACSNLYLVRQHRAAQRFAAGNQR